MNKRYTLDQLKVKSFVTEVAASRLLSGLMETDACTEVDACGPGTGTWPTYSPCPIYLTKHVPCVL